jgi:hypothetical protein
MFDRMLAQIGPTTLLITPAGHAISHSNRRAEQRQRRTGEMWKKGIRASLAATLAVICLASTAAVTAATNQSPGACNMLNANTQGLEGMDGSGLGPGRGEGSGNMIGLVVTSLGAGCTP